MLEHLPLLSFLSDTGMTYVRSFTMNQHTVEQIQTHLQNGSTELVSSMSVSGLWYCYVALLVCCVLCLLCLVDNRRCLQASALTILVAAVYYVLMLVYILLIVNKFCVTFYPNIGVFMPAIVIQMMILLRHNISDEIYLRDETDQ